MSNDDFYLLDANDSCIRVGQTVQVIAKNLKAFQVPKTAYGSFNEKGEFISSNSTNYLKIPVGLVGTITKLYDNDLKRTSANYPIQVQFVATDQHDVPVPFLMHFQSKEVELIEWVQLAS